MHSAGNNPRQRPPSGRCLALPIKEYETRIIADHADWATGSLAKPGSWKVNNRTFHARLRRGRSPIGPAKSRIVRSVLTRWHKIRMNPRQSASRDGFVFDHASIQNISLYDGALPTCSQQFSCSAAGAPAGGRL